MTKSVPRRFHLLLTTLVSFVCLKFQLSCPQTDSGIYLARDNGALHTAVSKVVLGICEFDMCISKYVKFIVREYEREHMLRDEDPDLFPIVDALGTAFIETSLNCASTIFLSYMVSTILV